MKRSNLVWVVIAVLVVALLGTGIFIYMQHKEMSDFKEQVEIDKQRSELEKEYSDLAAQYDQFEGGSIISSPKHFLFLSKFDRLLMITPYITSDRKSA